MNEDGVTLLTPLVQELHGTGKGRGMGCVISQAKTSDRYRRGQHRAVRHRAVVGAHVQDAVEAMKDKVRGWLGVSSQSQSVLDEVSVGLPRRRL